MTYGYCRISRKSQCIERQIRNILRAFPEIEDKNIYQEAYTGTKTEGRKEWQKLKGKVKAGDTIVFDSASRMSRNTENAIEDYHELFNKGVELVFLKEPHINTATYREAMKAVIPTTGADVDIILTAINQYLQILTNKQLTEVFAQAQKEVDDLHQRTKEGMETAKLNGKQIGQIKGAKLTTKKSLQAKEVIKKHSKDFGGTLDDSEVMKITGIARNTYYKYKKEIKAELQAQQE